MKRPLTKFAHATFRWLASKPHSKYQAFAYIVDRLIIGVLGTWITITAFVTNQAGALLLLVSIIAFMFLGLWLVSQRR